MGRKAVVIGIVVGQGLIKTQPRYIYIYYMRILYTHRA